MEAMVTFHVSTHSDIANGTHGHVVNIIIDAQVETSTSASH